MTIGIHIQYFFCALIAHLTLVFFPLSRVTWLDNRYAWFTFQREINTALCSFLFPYKETRLVRKRQVYNRCTWILPKAYATRKRLRRKENFATMDKTSVCDVNLLSKANESTANFCLICFQHLTTDKSSIWGSSQDKLLRFHLRPTT